MGHCVRSSVSSAAGSYGKRRKVSITTRLRRHATIEGRGREFRREKSSRGNQENLHVQTGTRRTARSDGISGILRRTTARGEDLIEGIGKYITD
jgi:hypothetical protein